MKTNERAIFSKKLCIELRKLGFKIIRTEPNFKYPQFDVWYFEETDDLIAALTNLIGFEVR